MDALLRLELHDAIKDKNINRCRLAYVKRPLKHKKRKEVAQHTVAKDKF